MTRWAVGVLLLSGCYRINVVADPLTAIVETEGGARLPVPTEVKMTPSLRAKRFTVSATGFRATELALRWKPLRWLRPREEVEVHLVAEHGPAGTWSR